METSLEISENQIGVSVSVMSMGVLEETHEVRKEVVPMSEVTKDLSERADSEFRP
jgi:hypothetical protein